MLVAVRARRSRSRRCRAAGRRDSARGRALWSEGHARATTPLRLRYPRGGPAESLLGGLSLLPSSYSGGSGRGEREHTRRRHPRFRLLRRGGRRRGGAPGARSGGPPREPRTPAAHAVPLRGTWTPLLRLIALIGLAILLVVLVVVWAQGCAGDRKRDAYADYMGDMGRSRRIRRSSARSSPTPLTTVGLKQDELESKLTA